MKNAADICADLTDKDVAVIIGGEHTTSSPSTVDSCGSCKPTLSPRQTTRPPSTENSLEELQDKSTDTPARILCLSPSRGTSWDFSAILNSCK
ncbi:hypothetical protein J6590_079743 [Homalodisca vitripennis]|nr:hypothetical protein J6590_079743 [Homalodisca vitripennis]